MTFRAKLVLALVLLSIMPIFMLMTISDFIDNYGYFGLALAGTAFFGAIYFIRDIRRRRSR